MQELNLGILPTNFACVVNRAILIGSKPLVNKKIYIYISFRMKREGSEIEEPELGLERGSLRWFCSNRQ